MHGLVRRWMSLKIHLKRKPINYERYYKELAVLYHNELGIEHDSACKDISRCRYNNKKVTLGSYDTPVEAFYAYKYFKECAIKYTADTYIDYIPTKLYNALYNYEIEITD